MLCLFDCYLKISLLLVLPLLLLLACLHVTPPHLCITYTSLGLHLPVIKASLGELNFVLASLPDDEASFANTADADLPFEALLPTSASDTLLENARLPSMGQIAEAPATPSGTGASSLSNHNHPIAANTAEISSANGSSGASNGKAVNLATDFRLWAEYFNSPLRCWEPLLEPFSARALVESCAARGTGVIVKVDNPLHVNVTGALLDTMDDALRIVGHITSSSNSGNTSKEQQQQQETSAAGSTYSGKSRSQHGVKSASSKSNDSDGGGGSGSLLNTTSTSKSISRAGTGLVRGEEEHSGAGRHMRVVHKFADSGGDDAQSQVLGGMNAAGSIGTIHGSAAGRSGDGSAAFMLRNLTGGPLRVYQPQQRRGTASDAAASVRADEAAMEEAYAQEARLVARRGVIANAATQARVQAEYLKLAEHEAEKAKASRKRDMILASERAHQLERQQQQQQEQEREMKEQRKDSQGQEMKHEMDGADEEEARRGAGSMSAHNTIRSSVGVGDKQSSIDEWAKSTGGSSSDSGSGRGSASSANAVRWFNFGKSKSNGAEGGDGGSDSPLSSAATDGSATNARTAPLQRAGSFRKSDSLGLNAPPSPALSGAAAGEGGTNSARSNGSQGNGFFLGPTLRATQNIMMSSIRGRIGAKDQDDLKGRPRSSSGRLTPPSPARDGSSNLPPAMQLDSDGSRKRDDGRQPAAEAEGSATRDDNDEDELAKSVWSPMDDTLAAQARADPLLVHLQYLSHRQRGALFFAPTKTVQRCQEVWEVPFDVQEEVVGAHETVLYAPARPRRIDAGAASAAADYRVGEALNKGNLGPGGSGGGGASGGGSGGHAWTQLNSRSRSALRRAWDAHQAREAAAAALALHKRAGAGEGFSDGCGKQGLYSSARASGSAGRPAHVESGHVATLQIAHHAWIEGVPADMLGTKSFDLTLLTQDPNKSGREMDSSHPSLDSTAAVAATAGAENPETEPQQSRKHASSKSKGVPPVNASSFVSQGGNPTAVPDTKLNTEASYENADAGNQGKDSTKEADNEEDSFTRGGSASRALTSSSSSSLLPQEGDWRETAMKRLVCDTVRSANGGREVTLRSCFRVRNSTGHALLIARAPDPRLAKAASKYIAIANYSRAVDQSVRRGANAWGWLQDDEGRGEKGEYEEEDEDEAGVENGRGRARSGSGDDRYQSSGINFEGNKDEPLRIDSEDASLAELYDVLLPGEEYFVPLADVHRTSLYLGASRSINDSEANDERAAAAATATSGAASAGPVGGQGVKMDSNHVGGGLSEGRGSRAQAEYLVGGIGGAGTGTGTGTDGSSSSQNKALRFGNSKTQLIKRARFSGVPIPLSNMVVEANEALVYAKRKDRPASPAAGLQLTFPLSFEAGQTWRPSSCYYRAQVHRCLLDRHAGQEDLMSIQGSSGLGGGGRDGIDGDDDDDDEEGGGGNRRDKKTKRGHTNTRGLRSRKPSDANKKASKKGSSSSSGGVDGGERLGSVREADDEGDDDGHESDPTSTRASSRRSATSALPASISALAAQALAASGVSSSSSSSTSGHPGGEPQANAARRKECASDGGSDNEGSKSSRTSSRRDRDSSGFLPDGSESQTSSGRRSRGSAASKKSEVRRKQKELRRAKKSFLPASSFKGAKNGFAFKNGPRGMGYYREAPSLMHSDANNTSAGGVAEAKGTSAGDEVPLGGSGKGITGAGDTGMKAVHEGKSDDDVDDDDDEVRRFSQPDASGSRWRGPSFRVRSPSSAADKKTPSGDGLRPCTQKRRTGLGLSFSSPTAFSKKVPAGEASPKDNGSDNEDVVIEDDDGSSGSSSSSSDDSSVSFSNNDVDEDESTTDYSDSVSEYSDDSRSVDSSILVGSADDEGAPYGSSGAGPTSGTVAGSNARRAPDVEAAPETANVNNTARRGSAAGTPKKSSMFSKFGGLGRGSSSSSLKGSSSHNKLTGGHRHTEKNSDANGKGSGHGNNYSEGHASQSRHLERFSAGGHELQFRTKEIHMSKPEQWEKRSRDILSYPEPLPLNRATLIGKDKAVKEKYRPGTVDYVLELHPPLVVENLLPHRAVFELVHAEGEDDSGGLFDDLGKIASTFQRDLKNMSKDYGGGSGVSDSGKKSGVLHGSSGSGSGGLASIRRKRMLWCQELAHGDAVAVHSVGLESELKLLINLGFCRSIGDGALIHVPSEAEVDRSHHHHRPSSSPTSSAHQRGGRARSSSAEGESGSGGGGLRGSVGQGVAGLGEHIGASVHDGFKDIKQAMVVVGLSAGKRSVDSSITLADRMGQRTVLHIKNEIGPAGNRKVTVFCPYWLVNLTQYSLLFKQDTKSDRQLPAGSLPHFFEAPVSNNKAKGRGRSTSTGRPLSATDTAQGFEQDDAKNDNDGDEAERAAAAAADAAAAEEEEMAAQRRNGSFGQRLFQMALDRREAARQKRAKWLHGSGLQGDGEDTGLGEASGDSGLAWRRDKYRCAFPGATPLLHSLFTSDAAAEKRAKRVVETAQRAAVEVVATAAAEADSATTTSGAPGATHASTPRSATAAVRREGGGGTEATAASQKDKEQAKKLVKTALSSSTSSDGGSSRIKAPGPPPSSSSSTAHAKEPFHSPSATAAGAAGSGRRHSSTSWRDSSNLAHFLEASVGGLVDLPLDQVVSLASMFNWADSRQRDVVEVLQGLARGDRLCLKAALPHTARDVRSSGHLSSQRQRGRSSSSSRAANRRSSGNFSSSHRSGANAFAEAGSTATAAARWRQRSARDATFNDEGTDGAGTTPGFSSRSDNGNGRASSRGRCGGQPSTESHAFVSEQTREWSPGFSLDALNIDQSLTLLGGATDSSSSSSSSGGSKLFEIGFVSRPAPGRLGAVGTRIAYFYPRFVVVNLLERPLALVQPEPRGWNSRDLGPSAGDARASSEVTSAAAKKSAASGSHRPSFGGSSDYAGHGSYSSSGGDVFLPRDRASQVAPFEWAPFHLPFARGKRHVMVDLGDEYKNSACLPMDQTGEYTVALRQQDVISDSDRVKVQSEYDIHYPYGGGRGTGSTNSGGGGGGAFSSTGLGTAGGGSGGLLGRASSGDGLHVADLGAAPGNTDRGGAGTGTGSGGGGGGSHSTESVRGGVAAAAGGESPEKGEMTWSSSDGLGLWLETDVDNDCVVVRKVKPKSYADVEEDVRPGDQVWRTRIAYTCEHTCAHFYRLNIRCTLA